MTFFHLTFFHLTIALSLLLGSVAPLAQQGDGNSDSADSWGNDAWSQEGWEQESWEQEEASAWKTSQFVELGYGEFRHDNVTEQQASLAEARYGFSLNRYWGDSFFSSKLELLGDHVADQEVDVLVRELYLNQPLGARANLRIGQQVLTWGTGDLVFLNDLFAKDWQAFFSGREQSYLKAPSASLRLSLYGDILNMDWVWTPEFAADEYISGERFSYYSPQADKIVAAPPKPPVDEPNRTLANGELAARFYNNSGGLEKALYLYRGFYKQPQGFDPDLSELYFPRLNVIGASVRSALGPGISNLEWAWWDSADNRDGDEQALPHSQHQLLLGYEQELISKLTLGLQYLGQFRQHDNELLEDQDKRRQTLTTRLRWLAWQDKLTTSIFLFYSPDDKDHFVMPKLAWRHDDNWSLEAGLNQFHGRDKTTFWGQMELNSNIYVRTRYVF